MTESRLLGVLKMGEASTHFYIQLLTKSYENQHLNDFKPWKLISADFEVINSLLPNRSLELEALMVRYFEKLSFNCIDVVLIPNITIHETIDAVQKTLSSTIAVAHPLSGAIERMLKAGNKTAVLFGSIYTMTSSYIKTVFADAGIKIVKPNSKDVEFIDFVRRQVFYESASAEILKEFNKLVVKYSNDKSVLIACSELSLVLDVSKDSVLDMAAIQVAGAISMILD